MAAADTLFLAELRREQLLDGLEGKVPEPRPVSVREVERLDPGGGEISAIWRVPPALGGAPLPQVIVGDPAQLEDLFAWSATYLRVLGPLTAHTRVLTADQLRTVLRQQPAKDWWALAGGAVGMVICEVLAHMKHTGAVKDLGLMVCRSTLSHALVRAAALGVPAEALGDLAESWEVLRSQTGGTRSAIPLNAGVEVARALFERGEPSSDLRPPVRWFATLRNHGNPIEVLREVASCFGLNFTEIGTLQITERTAEERVKLFDRIVPALVGHSSQDRSHRAFSVALFAFLCRPGLSQQAALLAHHLGALPESALWLGAMQVLAPVAETLANGDGLGWRLAHDLCQPEDVFSAPHGDVALLEFRVLLRGRGTPKIVTSLTRSYMEVELYPGVLTLVRTVEPSSPKQTDLPMEAPPSRAEDSGSNHGVLLEVERALEAALRSLRTSRSAPYDDRYGGRRKRR